jgi:hypothetical protein
MYRLSRPHPGLALLLTFVALAALIGGCGSSSGAATNPPASGGGGILPGGSGIDGVVTTGPTCPVVKVGDPACNDRPVPSAVVVVLNNSGNEVARVTTDAAGRFRVALPSGPYRLVPQPIQGFMGQAAPVDIVVADGAFAAVSITYDTGIR